MGFAPEFQSQYSGGVTIGDLWSVYETSPDSQELKLEFELGTANDPDSPDLQMSVKVASAFKDVLQVVKSDLSLTLSVNVKLFHDQNMMPEFEKDVTTSIEVQLDDGTNKVDVEIPIKFTAKPTPPEPEPEEEPEEEAVEEKTEDTASSGPAFVPTFNFDAVP